MKTIVLFLLIAMISSLTVIPVHAANQSTITVIAPTTNADGTTLTDLAGIKIYLGKNTGAYTITVDIPGTVNGSTVTYSIKNIVGITSGTWFARATAYDTAGNESGYSTPERVFTLDTIAPAAPGCTVN